MSAKALYGYCPHCGLPGLSRERRPNGNDRCSQGHVYPSADALREGDGGCAPCRTAQQAREKARRRGLL
jgi:hypothetical protein